MSKLKKFPYGELISLRRFKTVDLKNVRNDVKKK